MLFISLYPLSDPNHNKMRVNHKRHKKKRKHEKWDQKLAPFQETKENEIHSKTKRRKDIRISILWPLNGI